MLHGIISEQGKFPDVRDGISEKMNIFSYKSLASAALTVVIIVL